VNGHFIYRFYTMIMFKEKDDEVVLIIIYRKYTINDFEFLNKKPEKISGFLFITTLGEIGWAVLLYSADPSFLGMTDTHQIPRSSG